MDTPILTIKEHWFARFVVLLLGCGGVVSAWAEVLDASRSDADKVAFGLGTVLMVWGGYRFFRYDRTVLFEDRLTVGNFLRTRVFPRDEVEALVDGGSSGRGVRLLGVVFRDGSMERVMIQASASRGNKMVRFLEYGEAWLASPDDLRELLAAQSSNSVGTDRPGP